MVQPISPMVKIINEQEGKDVLDYNIFNDPTGETNKELLKVIRKKKYTSLTVDQIEEAKALYLHLLNHIEVQDAPIYRGMPCCKICNKSAYQIYAEESHKPEVDSSQPLDVKQEGGNGVPPTLKSVGIPPKIL